MKNQRISPKGNNKSPSAAKRASPKRSPKRVVKNSKSSRSPLRNSSPKRSPRKIQRNSSPKRSPTRNTSVRTVSNDKIINLFNELKSGKVLQASMKDGNLKIKTRDAPTRNGKFIFVENVKIISDNPEAYSTVIKAVYENEAEQKKIIEKFMKKYEKYISKKEEKNSKSSSKKGKVPDFTSKKLQDRLDELKEGMYLDVSDITDTESKVKIRPSLPGPTSKLYFVPGFPLLSNSEEKFVKAINFLDNPEQYSKHIEVFRTLQSLGKDSQQYKDFMKKHQVDVALEPIARFQKKIRVDQVQDDESEVEIEEDEEEEIKVKEPKRNKREKVDVSSLPRSPTSKPKNPLSTTNGKSFSPNINRLSPVISTSRRRF